LKIKKFGECAGQIRGQLESGIVRKSDEIVRIIDRENDMEKNLKEELGKEIEKKKKMYLETLQHKIDKEKKEQKDKIENRPPPKKIYTNQENCVRITGFPKNYTEQNVREIFESKNLRIRKINLLRDGKTGVPRGIAYVDFEQSLTVKEAVDLLNDTPIGNCILSVEPAKGN
jgi:RNA recognition motif-containing protein